MKFAHIKTTDIYGFLGFIVFGKTEEEFLGIRNESTDFIFIV